MAVQCSLFMRITYICAFLCFSSTAISSPFPAQPLYIPNGTGKNLTWEIVNSNGIQCETDRSSDYYGLGVRLGIYMAWFTGWVANNFVPSEIAGAMDTNAIFLFALVIAMVRCTITDLVSRMDGIVLEHLSTGTVFSVISIWGYRTCLYRREGPARGIANFGGFGTHLRLLLCITVCGYSWWFWYYGMAGALGETESGTGPCETVYTFLFSKLRADGRIRTWYIVVYTGCMIYFGIMTLVSIIGPVSRVSKMRWLARYGYFRNSSRLKFATGLTYGQLRNVSYILRIANLFLIVYSMVKIECTLNYNHIASVLGENGRIFFPSQLIPTVIGACSLVRVCYIRFESWRSPADFKPSLDHVPTNPTKKIGRPNGKAILKLFAPETQSDASPTRSRQPQFEDSDVDEEMKDTPLWWRMLVSWLPWLQAASVWWKDDIDRSQSTDAHDTTSQHREIHSQHEKDTSEQVERRGTWDSEHTLAASPTSISMRKTNTVHHK